MNLYHCKQDCCGCGACMAVCHKHAIYMRQDQEGFFYPAVDKKLCVDCGKCLEVCPMKFKEEKQVYNHYYGAKNADQTVRSRSSSGGIFSILADYVLEKSGSVFAAGYDSDMKVVHMEISKTEDLDLVRRTKYVQSDMNDIYQQIQIGLKEGRWILFVGTPCQTEALRKYLRIDSDRLILVDLICYGAASPGIWKKYLYYLSRKYKGKINEYYFRDKRNKDRGQTVSWKNQNGEKVYPLYDDPYCRMYFRSMSLRPSCYQCPFCCIERNSDFTIGDFWGIEKIRPDMEDGMGTSLVIAHSEKAEKIWEEIRGQYIAFECTKMDIWQPRLQKPTECPSKRKLFMMIYKYMPFSILINRFSGVTFKQQK